MPDDSAMLVLGIDTSGAQGSVALCWGLPEGLEAIAHATLGVRTYSAQLVPEIAGLLHSNHLSAGDLDGYAVVSGPGSFTGLRVGLAAVKGLAEILQKPIAAVSMLEVMAECAARSFPGESPRVHAVLDASRGEFFLGTYIRNGNQVQRDERLADYEELLRILGNEPVIICEASVAAALSPSGITLRIIPRPDSRMVAQAGMQKLLAGEIVSAEGLSANYMRDAGVNIPPGRNRPATSATASPAPAKRKL